MDLRETPELWTRALNAEREGVMVRKTYLSEAEAEGRARGRKIDSKLEREMKPRTEAA